MYTSDSADTELERERAGTLRSGAPNLCDGETTIRTGTSARDSVRQV